MANIDWWKNDTRMWRSHVYVKASTPHHISYYSQALIYHDSFISNLSRYIKSTNAHVKCILVIVKHLSSSFSVRNFQMSSETLSELEQLETHFQ